MLPGNYVSAAIWPHTEQKDDQLHVLGCLLHLFNFLWFLQSYLLRLGSLHNLLLFSLLYAFLPVVCFLFFYFCLSLLDNFLLLPVRTSLVLSHFDIRSHFWVVKLEMLLDRKLVKILSELVVKKL